MLFDTHCHLEYDYSPRSTEDLLRDADLAGVKLLMTIGTEIPSMPKVQEISDRFEHVYHTVGVHPHEAITMEDGTLGQLRQWASHPKCKAIGEIGLDYHYDHSPREVQRARLQEQLDLALELELPVVIHAREAEEDLVESLGDYAAKVQGRDPGIIHCFSGTPEFGEKCVAMGFCISFSGILTFKKATELREFAAGVRKDRLLVETDSPYLAPVPKRGKTCEPAFVRHTCEKLAELHGMSLEDMARLTWENGCRVFGIK